MLQTQPLYQQPQIKAHKMEDLLKRYSEVTSLCGMEYTILPNICQVGRLKRAEPESENKSVSEGHQGPNAKLT